MLDEKGTGAALAMVDDRNLTVHTYNEALARAIFARLAGHAEALGGWLDALEKTVSELDEPAEDA